MATQPNLPPPFQVVKKRHEARNYYRRLPPKSKQRIIEGVQKICRDPLTDGRRWAIKPLAGRLSGLLEYKMPDFARIIYRIVAEQQRRLEIHDILFHL